MREGRGRSKCSQSLPTTSSFSEWELQPQRAFRASRLRNRVQHWKFDWIFRSVWRPRCVFRPGTQPLSRTKLLQHRLGNHEEHQRSGLGEGRARNRLPVLQLFQSSELWDTGSGYIRSRIWTNFLPGATTHRHLGERLWRRRCSQDDSIESPTSVLKPDGNSFAQ